MTSYTKPKTMDVVFQGPISGQQFVDVIYIIGSTCLEP